MLVDKKIRSKIEFGELQFIAAKIATQEDEGVAVHAHPNDSPQAMIFSLAQKSADSLTCGQSNAAISPDFRVSFSPGIPLTITYLGKGLMRIDLQKKIMYLTDFWDPKGKPLPKGPIAVVLGEQFRDFTIVTQKT